MVYQYEPKGVCSMQMNIEVEGEIIKDDIYNSINNKQYSSTWGNKDFIRICIFKCAIYAVGRKIAVCGML